MSKIKITASISGQNVQIGDRNQIVVAGKLLDRYEDELLDLFNKYCPSMAEKEQLIEDLHKVNSESAEKVKPAERLLSFINQVGSGLVSNAIFVILTSFLNSPHH